MALLLACDKPAPVISNPGYYYVMNGYENIVYNTLPNGKIVDPERSFYSRNNIILYGDTAIYLHQQYPKGWKCIVEDEGRKVLLPDYIYLVPDSIKKISCNSLDSLLTAIFSEEKLFNKYGFVASIISYSDTIRNPAYAIANNHLHNALDRGMNLGWIVRKPTEQERVVLEYKLANKPYSFKNIKWKDGFRTQPPPPPPPLKQR
jgi:hypothetical protein